MFLNNDFNNFKENKYLIEDLTRSQKHSTQNKPPEKKCFESLRNGLRKLRYFCHNFFHGNFFHPSQLFPTYTPHFILRSFFPYI